MGINIFNIISDKIFDSNK